MKQMFYGVVQYDDRSELIAMDRDPSSDGGGYTSRSYIWAVQEGLLPIFPEDGVYQMDNAKIHTSKLTMETLNALDINILPFPPYSPDLNIIEHIWALLKRKINEIYPNLADEGGSEEDRERFIKCAKEAWDAIDQAKIRKLFDSMPRRLKAVRKAKGWQTKY